MISSRGVWVSSVIASVIYLASHDGWFLFYALIFCALALYLEGVERGRK